MHPLEPLILSSKRSVWRMHDHADEDDKEFQKIRGLVLAAFQNTCIYCSHQSEKFQEGHHKDDDHKNNSPKNIVCACPLCHQVHHLGLAGIKEGADLIYAPELSQAEINQLALTIWMVIEAKNAADNAKVVGQRAVLLSRLDAKAKAVMGVLDNRRGTVTLRLKKALMDPELKFPQELIEKVKIGHMTTTLLSNVLMGLDDNAYAKREELLGGIRILPKATRFRKRIAYWHSEQSKVVPVDSWYNFVSDDHIPFLIQHAAEKIERLSAKPVEAG